METIDLAEKLSRIEGWWRPRIVGRVNDTDLKIAKVRGSFDWHAHPDEDEAFLVLAGRLRIELRDGVVELGPGQMCVVPRGVEHRPVADGETHILLVEPAGTRNTGDRVTDRTVEAEWI